MSLLNLVFVQSTTHPWGNDRPGFSLLQASFSTEAEMAQCISRAHALFWHTWIASETDLDGYDVVLTSRAGERRLGRMAPMHP